MSPTIQFFLQKGNKFLDKSDAFLAPAMGHEFAQPFDTEDAALDKAEAMGLDLDAVDVRASKKQADKPA
jgi:hypothetical protein